MHILEKQKVHIAQDVLSKIQNVMWKILKSVIQQVNKIGNRALSEPFGPARQKGNGVWIAFGSVATRMRWMHFVENFIFLFQTCWRVSLYKCAIRIHFAIKPQLFWTFWHQHQKNRPMDDKIRTKVAKICIKTKWRPTESRIFKLNHFWRNMSQIVPYDIPQ